MTKKILVTAVLVGTLATGAFAYNKDCQNGTQRGMMQGQNAKQGMHKQNRKMHKQSMRKRGGMQMLSQLKLTDEQQFQVSILRDEMRLEMKKLRGAKHQGKMMQFVGDNGFDKKAFMKEADSKHTKMMDIRANHMEKVFKILTKEQISELKKNLNS